MYLGADSQRQETWDTVQHVPVEIWQNKAKEGVAWRTISRRSSGAGERRGKRKSEPEKTNIEQGTHSA